MRPVNDNDVLADLDRHTAEYGNGARLAKSLGMEPAHLREMKSGRRSPNTKVAAGLGWELRWVRPAGAFVDGGLVEDERKVQP